MEEHRWSPRTRVNLDVDLSIDGYEFTDRKTRDIGMGGVFVMMNEIDFQNDDSMVEVIFKIGSEPASTRHKITAKVVRVSNDGVGLMFRDFDASAFRSLQEVLNYAQTNALQ